MAHAINVNSVAAPISMDKKTYSVDIKGLIAHIFDILFGKSDVEKIYYASDLSDHMSRDIGLMR